MWLVVLSISDLVKDASFNIAYWLFAFAYFQTARRLPFHNESEVPESVPRFERKLNCIVLTFCVALPLADAICVYAANSAFIAGQDSPYFTWLVAHIVVESLDDLVKVTTLICLAYAMVMIRAELT